MVNDGAGPTVELDRRCSLVGGRRNFDPAAVYGPAAWLSSHCVSRLLADRGEMESDTDSFVFCTYSGVV